jgi:hypothetical protein
LVGFFVIGTNLLARVAVQGVEQALVATVIEHGSAGMGHLSSWARGSWRSCFRR